MTFNLDPDKFKPSWTGHKIKFIIALAHLTFLGYCFSSEFNWTFILLGGPFLWFFISKMGMEVGFHRLFCHKGFKTGPMRTRMLLILGTISSVGSCLTWVATHRVHHKHADHLGDPQNSRTQTWWKN
jgi:stearoyl-CoA desaturase (delta-9 desaturase)